MRHILMNLCVAILCINAYHICMDDKSLENLRADLRLAIQERRLSAWAKLAGVDQSWCSRLASGHIRSPGYARVKKLMDTRPSSEQAA